MLHQAFHEFQISTRGRGLNEFTDQVAAWISTQGFSDGLLTLHVRHTSASLLIQENADPDVRRDFEKFFARLVPARAEAPKLRPIGPQDLMATVFQVLGVPPDLHYTDQSGRPVPMLDGGKPIAELI